MQINIVEYKRGLQMVDRRHATPVVSGSFGSLGVEIAVIASWQKIISVTVCATKVKDVKDYFSFDGYRIIIWKSIMKMFFFILS